MVVKSHAWCRLCPASKRRWSLSRDWRALYEMGMASEFNRLARLWWFLLPTAHIFLSAQVMMTYWREMSSSDKQIHLSTSAFILLMVLMATWAVMHPRWLIKRHRWIPWVFASVEGGISLEMALVGYTPMAQHLMIHIILLVLISFWGLRLSLGAATWSAALGGIAGMLPLLLKRPELVATFTGHHVLISVVCLFCVFLCEEKSRESFLQAVELAKAQSRLRLMNTQLQELAHQDALTRLPNRRALDGALIKEWQRARRGDSPLSVLLIDIDHFKQFNDAQGHLEGDACLVTVAQALKAALQRPADMVARFGGEEFVVVLPETDECGAAQVAARLIVHIDDLGLPHPKSSVAHHVTVSVGGVTLRKAQGLRPMDLLKAADEALYQAKSRGRHRAELHAGLRTRRSSTRHDL